MKQAEPQQFHQSISPPAQSAARIVASVRTVAFALLVDRALAA
ncbi:hypothetical protein P3T23_003854 [Paraburkholderia sp. GAS448]